MLRRHVHSSTDPTNLMLGTVRRDVYCNVESPEGIGRVEWPHHPGAPLTCLDLLIPPFLSKHIICQVRCTTLVNKSCLMKLFAVCGPK